MLLYGYSVSYHDFFGYTQHSSDVKVHPDIDINIMKYLFYYIREIYQFIRKQSFISYYFFDKLFHI